MSRFQRISSFTVSAATLGLALGCASPGSQTNPGPISPRVAGVYDGQLDLGGTVISGMLEMIQDGSQLEVTFSAPEFGISASGEGFVDSDGIHLRLDYDVQCPGEARLDGTFAAEDGLFSGLATASDCTGNVAGSFSFRRR